VDATTGTAVLTDAAIRSALGLASANLDTQLGAIPAATRTEFGTELTQITEVHSLHGLGADTLTVTPTSRAVGAISQTIGGDGSTSTTITRD
jgi:hypothetical protein